MICPAVARTSWISNFGRISHHDHCFNRLFSPHSPLTFPSSWSSILLKEVTFFFSHWYYFIYIYLIYISYIHISYIYIYFLFTMYLPRVLPGFLHIFRHRVSVTDPSCAGGHWPARPSSSWPSTSRRCSAKALRFTGALGADLSVTVRLMVTINGYHEWLPLVN